MSANAPRLADSERPWIGLASFTEADSEFFAGRGEETDELLRLVRRDTLTLLYGVSGLGKTSLLHAGLFPRLHADDCLPVPIRLDHLDNSVPLAAQVHRAIARSATEAGTDFPAPRADQTLWEYFHRTGHDFWSRRNEPVTPVLVFDQFEELFTVGRENPDRARRADAFITELADLVENRAPAALRADPQLAADFDFKPVRLKVLLSMREDYLADLDRLRSRFRDLGRNRLRLLPMGEAQARAVIALGAPLLAPGVEDRILASVAGRRSAAADTDVTIAPALLSLVLRELNERRLARGASSQITADLLDLEETKILEGFYLRSLEGCPPGMRIFIEDALITAGGFRNSCALDDALAREGVTPPVLDELVNRRLLAYEDRHRTRRVELTHDVLVPVIKASRNARRAREERERAELQEREALARAESARAEAERKTRAARRQLIAAGVLVALAIAGAWYGFDGRSRALMAERRVKEVLASADVDTAILLQQEADAVSPLALAHLARALRTHPDDRRAREFLVSLLRDSPWCLPAVEPLLIGAVVIEARFTADGQQIVVASRDRALGRWDATTGAPLGRDPIPQPIKGFSQDGSRLLTATEDKTVQVWSTRDGKAVSGPIGQAPSGGKLSASSLSGDGRRVVTASGGYGGNARVWNADTGESIGETPQDEGVMAASLSRDGRQLITILHEMENVTAFGRVRVQPWELGPGPSRGFPNGNLAVFSEDGRWILVAGQGGVAQAFEVDSTRTWQASPGHGDVIVSAGFSSDGRWIVTGSRDKTARIWDAETGQPRGDPLLHDSAIVSVGFSPDGQQVLTVAEDNIARIWNAANGQVVCEPLRHDGPIVTALFRSTGAEVLTASEDKTARLWNVSPGEAAGRPLAGNGANAARFNIDGTGVVRMSQDGSTQTWDVESGVARGPSRPARDGTEPWALSADGQRQVSVSRSDRTAQVWNTQTGEPIGKPVAHKDANESFTARLSADGTRIVTSHSYPPPSRLEPTVRYGDARVWEVETGRSIGAIRVEPDYRVGSVSADGRIILIAPDNTAQIWDVVTGQPVGQRLRHYGKIEATFSRDGKFIVTASNDRTARVWNAQNGEPITEPLRLAGEVRAASFNQDGTRIVVSAGHMVSIWDSRTGKPLGRPLRHDQAVTGAAFSPDSQRILTISGDGITHVWDVAFGATSALPDWLPELAEALGGQRFNEDEVIESTTPAIAKNSAWKGLAALRDDLMTPGSLRELKGDDYWSRFGRWFFTRGPERTISPNSKVTRGDLDRLRSEAATKK